MDLNLKLPTSCIVCVGLISGILFYWTATPWIVYSALPVSLSILFLSVHTRHTAFLFFFIATIFGLIRTHHQMSAFRQCNLSTIRTSCLLAQVTNIQRASTPSFKTCLTIALLEHNATVQLYTNSSQGAQVGDTIAVFNLDFSKPMSQSYQLYLYKEGITHSVFCHNPHIQIVHHPHWSAQRWLHTWKQTLYRAIQKKCSFKTFIIFSALFLGEKSVHKRYFERMSLSFKEWGIVHFLARSGLHLVIFVLLWELVLGLIPLYYNIKQFLLCAITFLYFLVSLPTVSFVRSLILFFTYKYSSLHKRPTHFMHLLATTCCIVLITNPPSALFSRLSTYLCSYRRTGMASS